MHHYAIVAALICLFGMAASFDNFFRLDGRLIATNTMTCDSSYPAGGYPVSVNVEGMGIKIDDLIPIAQSTTNIAVWNKTTGCIQILADSGGGLAEVSPGTDLHTLTVKILCFGA